MTSPLSGQAPATAPTTDPAGQAPANPTTTTTPTPGAQAAPWERDGQPFDAARAWSLIENLRADLAAARTGQPTATPPASTPPATPTTASAAETPPADLAGQLGELRAQLARERAARRHGLDDDLVDLLGAGSDEQIEARAKALADRLTGTAPSGGSPVPRRPVEQLRGGADPTSDPEETDPEKLAAKIRRRF